MMVLMRDEVLEPLENEAEVKYFDHLGMIKE